MTIKRCTRLLRYGVISINGCGSNIGTVIGQTLACSIQIVLSHLLGIFKGPERQDLRFQCSWLSHHLLCCGFAVVASPIHCGTDGDSIQGLFTHGTRTTCYEQVTREDHSNEDGLKDTPTHIISRKQCNPLRHLYHGQLFKLGINH
jgi:hypothetical protein